MQSIIQHITSLCRQLISQKSYIFYCLIGLTLFGVWGIYAYFNQENQPLQHLKRGPVQLDLTDAEKTWLADHKVIRVGVKTNWKPIEFMSDGKRYRGLTIDYLDLLEQVLGVKFTKIEYTETPSAQNVDMLSSVSNINLLHGSDFVLTKPIFTFPIAIYTNVNNSNKILSLQDLQGKRAGIFRHGAIVKQLESDWKTINLLKVDIAEEGFRALQLQYVDAYIGNKLVVDYETSLQGLGFLKNVAITPYTTSVSMAVRNDWPVLISILEKASLALEPEKSEIIHLWDISFKRNQTQLLGYIAISLLPLIGFVLLRYFRLMQAVRLKEKESLEFIWRQANYDFLTNLPNRSKFYSKLKEEMQKSDVSGLPLALLFIDLDHFKEVNDHYGHAVGDKLLIEAANRIGACTRTADTTSRLGGDEFTVILSELADVKLAQNICNRIVQQLQLPFELDNTVVLVTASIGLVFYPKNGESDKELTRHADIAMYEAKKIGRNCSLEFNESMKTIDTNRLNMIKQLQMALKNDEFRLYYQPIIELKTGNIFKAEGLLRWQHPKKGLLLPKEFIDIAEESNLMFDIGEHVLQQVISDLIVLRRELTQDFQLSVNVSPKQFIHHKAMINWIEALYSKGLPGNCLTLEITERLLLEPNHTTNHVLEKMYANGIKIAIDDFGTGYSALSYLNKFDIDYIKLDKIFVQNLNNKNNIILCETIIQMAHKMDIKVIAEGIETEAQRKQLLKLGCEYGQGFLFSKALPLAEFIQLTASTAIINKARYAKLPS